MEESVAVRGRAVMEESLKPEDVDSVRFPILSRMEELSGADTSKP